MKELSIFVDESGDFGEYAKHSPLIKQKVITMEELDGFSEELVDAVKQMVSRF